MTAVRHNKERDGGRWREQEQGEEELQENLPVSEFQPLSDCWSSWIPGTRVAVILNILLRSTPLRCKMRD
ncbi:hypothetical protein AOLI_G00183910 [Acnodon oligacanthus]